MPEDKMGTVFISREEKAEWGFACNQSADGTLWAGKGYKRKLNGQLNVTEVAAIATALKKGRDNRMGRFWIDRENRTVTMMVGESQLNKYMKTSY